MAKAKDTLTDEGLDNNELELDDFDTDLDMDFDFDADPSDEVKDDRRPVASVDVKSVLKDGLSVETGAMIGGRIRDEFTSIDSGYSAIVDTTSDITRYKDDLLKDIAPTINRVKRVSKMYLPKVEKLLPKKLYEKLDNILHVDDEENRAQSEEQLRTATINSHLSDVFGAQQDIENDRYLRDKTDAMIETGLSGSRHKESVTVLSQVRNILKSNQLFFQGVFKSYLMKSLELKYRQLFISKDMLTNTKGILTTLINKLDSIKHNTSLPDIVKTKYSEEFAALARERIMGAVGQTVGDFTANFRQNMMKNIKENIFEKATTLINEVGGGVAEAAEMSEEQRQMEEEFGEVSDNTSTGLVKSIFKKILVEGGFVAAKAGVGQQRFEDFDAMTKHAMDILPYKLNQLAKSEGLLGSIAGTIMPTHDEERGVLENVYATKGDTPVPFDLITRKSIVEIIPGFLSKIHQQASISTNILKQQLTANLPKKAIGHVLSQVDEEELVFDKTTEDFISASEFKQKRKDELFGDKDERTEDVANIVSQMYASFSRKEGADTELFDEALPDIMKFITNISKHIQVVEPYKILEYLNGGQLSTTDDTYLDWVFTDLDSDARIRLAGILSTTFFKDIDSEDVSESTVDKDAVRDFDQLIARLGSSKDKYVEKLGDINTFGYKRYMKDILGDKTDANLAKEIGDLETSYIEKHGKDKFREDEVLQREYRSKVKKIKSVSGVDHKAIRAIQSDVDIDSIRTGLVSGAEQYTKTYDAREQARDDLSETGVGSRVSDALSSSLSTAVKPAKELLERIAPRLMNRDGDPEAITPDQASDVTDTTGIPNRDATQVSGPGVYIQGSEKELHIPLDRPKRSIIRSLDDTTRKIDTVKNWVGNKVSDIQSSTSVADVKKYAGDKATQAKSKLDELGVTSVADNVTNDVSDKVNSLVSSILTTVGDKLDDKARTDKDDLTEIDTLGRISSTLASSLGTAKEYAGDKVSQAKAKLDALGVTSDTDDQIDTLGSVSGTLASSLGTAKEYAGEKATQAKSKLDTLGVTTDTDETSGKVPSETDTLGVLSSLLNPAKKYAGEKVSQVKSKLDALGVISDEAGKDDLSETDTLGSVSGTLASSLSTVKKYAGKKVSQAKSKLDALDITSDKDDKVPSNVSTKVSDKVNKLVSSILTTVGDKDEQVIPDAVDKDDIGETNVVGRVSSALASSLGTVKKYAGKKVTQAKSKLDDLDIASDTDDKVPHVMDVTDIPNRDSTKVHSKVNKLLSTILTPVADKSDDTDNVPSETDVLGRVSGALASSLGTAKEYAGEKVSQAKSKLDALDITSDKDDKVPSNVSTKVSDKVTNLMSTILTTVGDKLDDTDDLSEIDVVDRVSGTFASGLSTAKKYAGKKVTQAKSKLDALDIISDEVSHVMDVTDIPNQDATKVSSKVTNLMSTILTTVGDKLDDTGETTTPDTDDQIDVVDRVSGTLASLLTPAKEYAGEKVSQAKSKLDALGATTDTDETSSKVPNETDALGRVSSILSSRLSTAKKYAGDKATQAKSKLDALGVTSVADNVTNDVSDKVNNLVSTILTTVGDKPDDTGENATPDTQPAHRTNITSGTSQSDSSNVDEITQLLSSIDSTTTESASDASQWFQSKTNIDMQIIELLMHGNAKGDPEAEKKASILSRAMKLPKIMTRGAIKGTVGYYKAAFNLQKKMFTGAKNMVTGGVSSLLKNNKLGRGISDAFGAGKTIAGKVGSAYDKVLGIYTNVGKYGLDTVKDVFRNKFIDVYLKDKVDLGNPVLKGADIKAGRYQHVDGTKINDSFAIKAPVLDMSTKTVVITQQDLDIGLVDNNNKPLELTVLSRGIRGILGGTKSVITGAFKSIIDTGKQLIRNKFVDVYLKDKVDIGNPLLKAQGIKDGEYIYADGKVVKDSYSITEPVYDNSNNALVTQQDLDTGLVDYANRPLTKDSLLTRGIKGYANIVKGIFGAGKAVVDAGVNVVSGLFKGGGTSLLDRFGKAKEGISVSDKSIKDLVTTHLLTIIDLLQPIHDKATGTIREGGYIDHLADKAAAKKKRSDKVASRKQIRARGRGRTAGILGGGGLLGSGSGSGSEAESGGFIDGATDLAAMTAGSVATDATIRGVRNRRNRPPTPGRAGLLRRAGSLVLRGGAAISGVVGGAAGIKAAAGVAAIGGAKAAAAAGLFLATNPVGWGILAAGAGYGIYRHTRSKGKVKDIVRIRNRGYMLPDKYISIVVKLEKDTYKHGMANKPLSNKLYGKYMKKFGLDRKDAKQLDYFKDWHKTIFIPVFQTGLNILASVFEITYEDQTDLPDKSKAEYASLLDQTKAVLHAKKSNIIPTKEGYAKHLSMIDDDQVPSNKEDALKDIESSDDEEMSFTDKVKSTTKTLAGYTPFGLAAKGYSKIFGKTKPTEIITEEKPTSFKDKLVSRVKSLAMLTPVGLAVKGLSNVSSIRRKITGTDATINQASVDLIKSYEGIPDGDPSTLNLDPYLCPGNVWTIGWGHAITHKGKQVRGKHNKKLAYSIFPGGITKQEAESLLVQDINVRAKQVIKRVKVPLSDNQLGAIVSFVYNVGIGNLAKSTLLKKLNAGDYQGAANEFYKWRRSNGQVLKGLVRRRAAEKALFLSDDISTQTKDIASTANVGEQQLIKSGTDKVEVDESNVPTDTEQISDMKQTDTDKARVATETKLKKISTELSSHTRATDKYDKIPKGTNVVSKPATGAIKKGTKESNININVERDPNIAKQTTLMNRQLSALDKIARSLDHVDHNTKESNKVVSDSPKHEEAKLHDQLERLIESLNKGQVPTVANLNFPSGNRGSDRSDIQGGINVARQTA